MRVQFLRLDYTPCPPDETPARFGFECPRRPGEMCSGLLIRTPENAPQEPPPGWRRRASWEWNGDRERPTFTPSINCLAEGPSGERYAGCGWHGWITNGEASGA